MASLSPASTAALSAFEKRVREQPARWLLSGSAGVIGSHPVASLRGFIAGHGRQAGGALALRWYVSRFTVRGVTG